MKHIITSIKALIGALVSVFLGLHYMIQLLFIAIWLDIITGLIAAWSERAISSEVSRKGIARKAIMILAVGGAELVSRLTGADITTPFGADFSLGAALAGYYCVQEAVSVTENISRAGAPLPRFITRKLERLKDIDKEV